MTWIKVDKSERWRIFISLVVFALLYNLIQALRGFPFFLDDLLKRLFFDYISFLIAFSITHQLKNWFNTYYDWNNNPKQRFIVESIVKGALGAGIIILLHVIFSFIFIILTIDTQSNPYTKTTLDISFFGNYTYISFFDIFIKFIVVLFVIELTVVVDFSTYLIQKWNSSKIEKEAFEKEKAQFSLELLRTQINPHFLFNNLNTLSSLIYIDQNKAADFLRKLSSVYRNILEYRDKESILLADEIKFYETYADLLQVRFMDMLFFDQQIEEQMLNKKIIPLTLQMLIENAIKHNVVSSSRPLTISIKTLGNMLVVSNNLQVKETREYSSGLGLVMISNRYQYLSDRKVIIEKTENIFKISVPLID
ncbi:MAG: sensor histidine kinase [Bacteroidia bacterium]